MWCGLWSTPDQPAALPYLEVEDGGTGPDALQRWCHLERFYGVPDSAGEASGLAAGLGLGLAVVDEIVRARYTV